jgi:hypothetical protein
MSNDFAVCRATHLTGVLVTLEHGGFPSFVVAASAGFALGGFSAGLRAIYLMSVPNFFMLPALGTMEDARHLRPLLPAKERPARLEGPSYTFIPRLPRSV